MKVYNVIFIFYFAFCFLFLNIWGIDAIEERIDFDFFADSETYMMLFRADLSLSELRNLNFNLLGPLSVLKLLNGNYYLVFFLNMFVFYTAFKKIISNYNINGTKFLCLLIVSPLMIGSVIGINKEIFSFLVLALLLQYNSTRKTKYLLWGVLLSFLVRWQLCVVSIIFALATMSINPFRKRRFLTLFVLIASISIIYPLNLSSFSYVDDVATLGAENATEGSGLFSVLIQIQNQIFGYVIAFIPKALFLFGGLIFRFNKVFDTSDLYNNLFVFSQSLFNMFLLYHAVRKKEWLRNDFIYFGFIYLVIFCISPIFAPRYLFPVSILFACHLSEVSKKKNYE
ncbi:hypothetical protein [Sphingobacterium gobiense]|uniref:Glycosyltransferase RgtA/B/C/D-like domain-containing protein n=1 Tax=Sphingobacterium gobiense TaxID=1382456 RepID=A0A2S9JG79_9SPHI|nr:hypothetical protein [Sphingobacterium gobiense]PRD51947.1 hypothetical protein C5749_16745 [Sphingobacterium gobiense]